MTHHAAPHDVSHFPQERDVRRRVAGTTSRSATLSFSTVPRSPSPAHGAAAAVSRYASGWRRYSENRNPENQWRSSAVGGRAARTHGSTCRPGTIRRGPRPAPRIRRAASHARSSAVPRSRGSRDPDRTARPNRVAIVRSAGGAASRYLVLGHMVVSHRLQRHHDENGTRASSIARCHCRHDDVRRYPDEREDSFSPDLTVTDEYERIETTPCVTKRIRHRRIPAGSSTPAGTRARAQRRTSFAAAAGGRSWYLFDPF